MSERASAGAQARHKYRGKKRPAVEVAGRSFVSLEARGICDEDAAVGWGGHVICMVVSSRGGRRVLGKGRGAAGNRPPPLTRRLSLRARLREAAGVEPEEDVYVALVLLERLGPEV